MARLLVSAAAATAAFVATGGNVFATQLAFAATTALTAPTVRTQGPRIEDPKVTGVSYGTPLPYVEGACAVAGFVAWASDIRTISTTTEVGGKGPGGAESTEFTYEVDVLYRLTANPIAGVRRIWVNGVIGWNLADDADSTSVRDSFFTERWRAIRVYTGAADQLPDPVMEAALGVGNVPAYRGGGSVFIEGLQLGGTDRLPLMKFEIATERGTVTTIVLGQFQNDSQQGRLGSLAFGDEGLQTLRKINSSTAYEVVTVGFDGEPSVDAGGDLSVSASTFLASGFGQSDTPCALRPQTTPTLTTVAFARPGSVWLLDAGVSIGGKGAFYDGTLYVGAESAGTSIFYRWAGPGAPAATQTLPTGVVYVAANVNQVAAMSGDFASIYMLSPTTLAIDDTIATPAGATVVQIVLIDDDGSLYVISNEAGVGHLYRREGSAWVEVSEDVGLVRPNIQSGGPQDRFAIRNGQVFRMVSFVDENGGVARIYTAVPTFGNAGVPLDGVVTRLSERTGLLQAGDLDAADLAGDVVRGFAVTQVTPTRTIIEMLMRAKHFSVVEGEQLKFVPRGAAPALTVPYEDMGAGIDDAAEQSLVLTVLDDVDQPAVVIVRYVNGDNDYQDGSEQSDRLATESVRTEAVELPLVMAPQEAKRVADVAALDLAVALRQVAPVQLSRKYAAIEPADVLLLTRADGGQIRARVRQRTEGGGLVTVQLAVDDATVVDSAALTDAAYAQASIVRAAGDTALEVMDIPLLRDSDDSPGFYIAANGASTSWRGYSLFSSFDDSDYQALFSANDEATMGVTTTALGTWSGGNVFDLRNTVTVNLGDGAASSVARDVLLIGTANTWLIGNEIVRAATASMVSAGVYTLSVLLRGRRGTERHVGTHAIGERVVLLSPTGMRRVPVLTPDFGRTRYLRAVTFGRNISTAETDTVAPIPESQAPFSPVDLRVLRDGVIDDAVIAWRRRTRLAHRFLAPGIEPPLGEASESYDAEVWDVGFANLIRTWSALTAPTVTYTSAEQTTDFGAPQPTIYLRIYQRSAVVGRGNVLEGSG